MVFLSLGVGALAASLLLKSQQRNNRQIQTNEPTPDIRQVRRDPRRCDPKVGSPHTEVSDVLLTDYYQITMAYAYWKSGKKDDKAVFDLYFRDSPFRGEFAVCAGVDDVVRFLNTFSFQDRHLDFIKQQLQRGSGVAVEAEFLQYLRSLDSRQVTVHAVREGDLIFPSEPVLRVEGPLIVCQLLETPLLNLMNFPCLVATQAARLRLAAGPDKVLLEFGCRRAQGPDGALSASRYSYLGGFNATSNVKAGEMFGIPLSGTHAHSLLTSFASLDELNAPSPVAFQDARLADTTDLRFKAWQYQRQVCRALGLSGSRCVEGELTAFLAYARCFPDNFLALVDSYDVLNSGLPNFLAVALLLREWGYTPKGVRLDSGDLAVLSKKTREYFKVIASTFFIPEFENLKIVASNDINEELLLALNTQGHEIDIFGIGTHLVTCQSQPALGMVYKLVELNGRPRLKLSQDPGKATLPGLKRVYRLLSKQGAPLADIIQDERAPSPRAGEEVTGVLLRTAQETKQLTIKPAAVRELLCPIWDDGRAVHLEERMANGMYSENKTELEAARDCFLDSIKLFEEKHLLPAGNAVPYAICASSQFHSRCLAIWQETANICKAHPVGGGTSSSRNSECHIS